MWSSPFQVGIALNHLLHLAFRAHFPDAPWSCCSPSSNAFQGSLLIFPMSTFWESSVLTLYSLFILQGIWVYSYTKDFLKFWWFRQIPPAPALNSDSYIQLPTHQFHLFSILKYNKIPNLVFIYLHLDAPTPKHALSLVFPILTITPGCQSLQTKAWSCPSYFISHPASQSTIKSFSLPRLTHS